MSITFDLVKSWANKSGNVNSNDEILDWLEKRNSSIKVNIEKVDFLYDGFWYYDQEEGYIRNKNNSFFQLAGYQEIDDDNFIIKEQPIILQDEIGYLGIICKKIDGELNFLMQAKIEPGNVNKIQISPTIQATKSNFTRLHGGTTPAYLDYFINAERYTIICDQVQSEQASRFYKKRNRNIIILVDEDIEVLDNFKWMTLGQIKELLKIDNLVNMDTRTVISCIPFEKGLLAKDELNQIKNCFNMPGLYESIFDDSEKLSVQKAFNALNDCKMFRKENSRLVPLKSMKGWRLGKKSIECRTDYPFKVIYCKIEIENREVKYWEQPLIEAIGQSIFGLFTCVRDGKRYFLVRVKEELGCFDAAELGPSVQNEPVEKLNVDDEVSRLFMDVLNMNGDSHDAGVRNLNHNTGRKDSGYDEGVRILYDVVLSEEGGRFYQEQNRNVIVEIDSDKLANPPKGYLWMSFAELNEMIRFSGCLNIQLRNLLAVVEC